VALLAYIGSPAIEGQNLTVSSRIDLRQLRYFLAVYDELHFGRAAEKLHIAQPPLSHAIRKLEGELGAQLLERTSRNVRPTMAGRVFAEEARKVLASFDFAVAETQRVGRLEPPIRVGCGIHMPARGIERFLAALKRRDAGVQAEVSHLLALEQVGRLRDGELDLGVFTYAEDYAGLDWSLLFPGESLIAFLPRSHRLASKPVLTPDDLHEETLLISPREVNPVFWDRLMGAFEQAGYRFARRHESSTDPRDVFLAVAGGLGVAFGPVSIKEMSFAVSSEVVSVPLDPRVAYPDTIVAWRADPPRHLSSRLGAVREAAAELFRESSFEVEASV
jgi:DNA-binding transcriptional LysR family regulator